MYAKPKGRARRDPLWNKESFLADLKHVGNIKGVCEIYANKGTTGAGWQGYYNSVSHWRDTDANFAKRMGEILQNSESTTKPGPGRPRLDGGDRSWQQDFSAALYKADGNRRKASKVTPYSFEQIQDMLDERSVSYDADFYKKVRTVEAEIAAEIEEMLLSLRKEEAFEDFNTSKITQTKAWYALKVLEKLDRMRYGRFVEMNMKAEHQHTHTVEVIPREQKLANLWEEQRKHLETRRLAIASGAHPDQKLDEPDPVIEVEVVDERSN